MSEYNALHSFSLSDCKKFEASGIDDVLSFDEHSVLLTVGGRELLIEGDGLKIETFKTDSGSFSLNGSIFAISYRNAQETKASIFSRLFK